MKINTVKVTNNIWKKKAINRAKENQALKKRNQELKMSRDLWHLKYMDLKNQKPISASEGKANLNGSKPKRYHYPTLLIWFSIQIMDYSGCSLRCCKHFIMELIILLELEISQPSYTTIRMWICKMGYYNYTSNEPDKKYKWVIFADESVTLGENKILMILGFCIENWTFARPIKARDVKLLHFAVSPKWEYQGISKILNNLKTNYNIQYVVGDKGNNLVKSYKESGLIHIPDCTHVLAKALEHYFNKNEIANEYLSFTGKLRQKWNMGKNTVYMPPSQRKKSRFHNLDKLIKWGRKILRNWKILPKEILSEFDWFKSNRETFKEMETINHLIGFILGYLKTTGYNKETATLIEKQLATTTVKTSFAEKFSGEIKEYLEFLRANQDLGGKILCCSDIIESIFGKLKYRINQYSEYGVTEFTFAMASIYYSG